MRVRPSLSCFRCYYYSRKCLCCERRVQANEGKKSKTNFSEENKASFKTHNKRALSKTKFFNFFFTFLMLLSYSGEEVSIITIHLTVFIIYRSPNIKSGHTSHDIMYNYMAYPCGMGGYSAEHRVFSLCKAQTIHTMLTLILFTCWTSMGSLLLAVKLKRRGTGEIVYSKIHLMSVGGTEKIR